MMNIVKIIIEQNKIKPFISFIKNNNIEGGGEIKDFIKLKYYDFLESIDNVKECKNLVKK